METKLVVNEDGYSIFEDDELIMKFDENKVIRFKNLNDKLQEYDKNGNCTHYKDHLREEFIEYNDAGQIVHHVFNEFYSIEQTYRYYVRLVNKGYHRNIPCKEIWKDYDKSGNEIHFKTDTGFETFSKYDDHNRIIYHKCISENDPFEIWIEYDEINHMVYYKTVKEVGNTVYMTKFSDMIPLTPEELKSLRE